MPFTIHSDLPKNYLPENITRPSINEIQHLIVFNDDDNDAVSTGEDFYDDYIEEEEEINDGSEESNQVNEEPSEVITEVEEDDIPVSSEENSVFSVIRNEDDVLICYDINADGSLIVLGYDEHVDIRDVTVQDIILQIKENEDMSYKLCLNHDGKYLAVKYDWYVKVWDIATKNSVFRFVSDELEWVTWHHSSDKLFAGFSSGEIFMWQIPQGKCTIYPVNESSCKFGIVSPDGTQLAAGYNDGGVKIWDIQTGAILSRFYGLMNDNSEAVSGLNYNFDGKMLIVKRKINEPLILNTENCDAITTIEVPYNERIEFAEFSPDPNSSFIATGNGYTGEVQLWTLISKVLIPYRRIKFNPYFHSFCWMPNAIFCVARNDKIYIINGHTGHKHKYLSTNNLHIYNFLLTQDRKKMLVSFLSCDHIIKLYEIESGILDTR